MILNRRDFFLAVGSSAIAAQFGGNIFPNPIISTFSESVACSVIEALSAAKDYLIPLEKVVEFLSYPLELGAFEFEGIIPVAAGRDFYGGVPLKELWGGHYSAQLRFCDCVTPDDLNTYFILKAEADRAESVRIGVSYDTWYKPEAERRHAGLLELVKGSEKGAVKGFRTRVRGHQKLTGRAQALCDEIGIDYTHPPNKDKIEELIEQWREKKYRALPDVAMMRKYLYGPVPPDFKVPQHNRRYSCESVCRDCSS